MEGEPAAPSLWDMDEVFLGKGPRGHSYPVVGYWETQRHAAKMSQEGGGIQDRIGLSQGIEVKEGKAFTIQQDVISLQIQMGRPGRDLFEARADGADDSVDLCCQMGTGPLKHVPHPLQIRDLVLPRVAPRG